MKTQNTHNIHSHQDYYYLKKESDQFYDRGFGKVTFDGNSFCLSILDISSVR